MDHEVHAIGCHFGYATLIGKVEMFEPEWSRVAAERQAELNSLIERHGNWFSAYNAMIDVGLRNGVRR